MKLGRLYIGILCTSVLLATPTAFSADKSFEIQSPILEANNTWNVSGTDNIKSPLFVAINRLDAHWEITGIYETAPNIPRADSRELLIASRDLQEWNAYGPKAMTGCDSFEAREYQYKTVCTSAFSETKTARAAVGIFLYKLSTNGIPVGYEMNKMIAAVRSIRPEQAQEMLTAFEKR